MAIRIGELALRSGLAASALRYYEEAGLLEPSARSEAGYRLYEAEAVGRLRFILRARALGLSLGEIRELVKGPALPGAAERERVRHAVAHKLSQVGLRLAELNSLRSELEALYVRLARAPGAGCGHLGDCECWLPTEEEVMAMTRDVQAVQECGCSDCPDPDCDCDCDCCRSG